MAYDDLKVEWIFSGQSGGSPGKPVVVIPPQTGRTASGHSGLSAIWGQSSERVECCPTCGKAKDNPDA